MFDIPGAIKSIGNLIDDLHTSDEEKRAMDIQEKVIDAQVLTGQMLINQAEAQHKSVFVAGWRPAIGWTGAFALFYKFIMYEILLWIWGIVDIFVDIPSGIKPPPPLDASQLYPIVMGMLGIGGMRSFDKAKGMATETIKTIPATVKTAAKKSKGWFARIFGKD
ncbi:MAG: hypothetical protein JW932_15525 [Deltaproteobacteria bacterium]|nr:hypothetical protein [Deltaproteobacteria bacterium]